MNLQTGTTIQSTAALNNTLFGDTVIFITTNNSDGAIGFVVNKPFGRSLNQLEEFKQGIPFPLYNGGPVDNEHLFFLHRRPDIIEEGVAVNDGVYIGGNFNSAVRGINRGLLHQNDIKLFIGYCGWDAGELEAEIDEGSWMISAATVELVFSA